MRLVNYATSPSAEREEDEICRGLPTESQQPADCLHGFKEHLYRQSLFKPLPLLILPHYCPVTRVTSSHA